ncbi:hypothetical protein B0H10DRAFT_1974885 [Mycena sp. CBHHK59/15]|nr:hypothetical protein B0H10DRAFT_1974885 [Mycena sp. CBHHK59/15]
MDPVHDGHLKNYSPNQVTNGGPIILVQAENEFSAGATRSPYMQAIIDLYRANGVVIPITRNDQHSGQAGNFSPDLPGPGQVNIYCNALQAETRILKDQIVGLKSNLSIILLTKQWPQFGGGFLLNWGAGALGGTGYEKYTVNLTNTDFASFEVPPMTNLGFLKAFTLQVLFGGTNWGGTAAPVSYTSYDYGGGSFLRISRDLLAANLLANRTNYTTSPLIHTAELRNPDTGAGFYVTRHDSSPSLGLTTTQILVTNYVFGQSKTTILYSTAEIMTWTIYTLNGSTFIPMKSGDTSIVVVLLDKQTANQWHAPIIAGSGEFGNFFSVGSNETYTLHSPHLRVADTLFSGSLLPVCQHSLVLSEMARTKQSARKSHGGPAPSKPLASRTLKNTSLAVKTAAKAGAKQKVIGRQVDKNNATHSELALLIQGGHRMEDGDGASQWCSNCANGGTMTGCCACPRQVCTKCIVVPDDVNGDEYKLYCPFCWSRPKNSVVPGNLGGPLKPYQGLFRDNQPLPALKISGMFQLRGQWPIIDTTPMAVVSIRLHGTPLIGDPANLVYNYVVPYYSDGSLALFSIEYDLVHKWDLFDAAIDEITEHLEGYDKVVVYVTTHTDPVTGDIHTTNGGESASAVGEVKWTAAAVMTWLISKQVLAALLPETLQNVVRKAKISMLFLLACGSLHSQTESRQQVAEFMQTSGFQMTWGFTAEDFLPNTAALFMQEQALSFLINNHAKSIQHLLATQYEMGVHTALVVYLLGGSAFRYTWAHPAIKPYGHFLPRQCPTCHCPSSWGIVEVTAQYVQIRCIFPECASLPTKYARGRASPLQKNVDIKARRVEGEWYGEWIIGSGIGGGQEMPIFKDLTV